jgi:hypothetical protein
MKRRHVLAVSIGATLLAVVLYLPDHIIGILAVLVSVPGLVEHVDLLFVHFFRDAEEDVTGSKPVRLEPADTVRVLARYKPNSLRLVWSGILPLGVDKESKPGDYRKHYPYHPEETLEDLRRDYGFTEDGLKQVRARYGLPERGNPS